MLWGDETRKGYNRSDASGSQEGYPQAYRENKTIQPEGAERRGLSSRGVAERQSQGRNWRGEADRRIGRQGRRDPPHPSPHTRCPLWGGRSSRGLPRSTKPGPGLEGGCRTAAEGGRRNRWTEDRPAGQPKGASLKSVDAWKDGPLWPRLFNMAPYDNQNAGPCQAHSAWVPRSKEANFSLTPVSSRGILEPCQDEKSHLQRRKPPGLPVSASP